MTYQRKEKIGEATLYLGDSLGVLPMLGSVDAVVTDPPYGVSGEKNSRTGSVNSERKNAYSGFADSVEYVAEIVIPIIESCIEIARGMVVTPGNRCLGLYPNSSAFGSIYQPASVGLQSWGRADSQPILYYGRSPHGGKGIPSQQCSFQIAGESAGREIIDHPCPKPVKLIERLVMSASLVDEVVIDPFMGSGTTGVACANLQRKFIGIEIEPKYFDIACERIDNAYRQGHLFEESA